MTVHQNLSGAATDLLSEVLAFAQGFRAERTFRVTNPADGSLIGEVPDMGAPETEAAIAAASAAFPLWAKKTARERATVLRNWYNLILERQNALAELLTLEQGKPFAEALGEVVFGAHFIEWFAEEGKRLYGDVIPSHAPDKRCLVIKQPIGVVGAITPWNFPSSMITRKVSPALAAGCTIVIKPAEDTPLSALALQMLAEKAGFPTGVMNIVTASRAEAVAGVLTSHPAVRKISFTGSTRVGKLLMRQCADTVKKLSLELGGNSPFIVFDDADLDAAVPGAIVTKFRNAGQACVATNRLYVQAGIRDAFTERLKTAMAALPVGAGLAEGTKIGPLINAAAVEKVAQLVRDATGKGAQVALGGGPHPRGGLFFEPTLLTGVDTGMEIATTEIFGPVAAIYSFETEDEVIARANDTPYGLAAYLWTRDIGRVFRVGEALEYGMVAINEVLTSNPATPFGGVKESGLGREGSRYGLEDFVEIKYLALGGI
jgi:succinate-semialdehyde dehydrogenase / glutarate-semialdehyde dehydrogenase